MHRRLLTSLLANDPCQTKITLRLYVYACIVIVRRMMLGQNKLLGMAVTATSHV
jgi:hypothetical protein